MKKQIISLLCMASLSATAMAGGFLTNTYQSIVFLRNPARDATTEIDAVYSNPAGMNFMNKGWHLSLGAGNAHQTRQLTSNLYGNPFELGTVNGVANGLGDKYYRGKSYAPVIPNLTVAYVDNRWSLGAHLGLIGGGGKCTFEDGIGMLESQVAMLPTVINSLMPGAVNGYSLDANVSGRQYYYGAQVNGGYKINDHLSVSAGLRVVYADCNYYGHVDNIMLNTAMYGQMPAHQFLQAALPTAIGTMAPNLSAIDPIIADKVGDATAGMVEQMKNGYTLNCDQTGWGVTPIIGVDWKINDKWNVAAKYEFKTKMRLENKGAINTSGLAEFNDGNIVPADIPGLLTFGAKYSPIEKLRLSAGAHIFFDKSAHQYEHRENLLKRNEFEVTAGAEYDVCKWATVSAGWQTTHLGLGENGKYINNISFDVSSNSYGIGARFRVHEKVAIDVAYFKTVYHHYRQDHADYNGMKESFASDPNKLGGLNTLLTQTGATLQDPTAQAAIATGIVSSMVPTLMAGGMPYEDAMAQAQLQAQNTLMGAGQELNGLGSKIAGLNTSGFDTYWRTSDVFGVGVVIDF